MLIRERLAHKRPVFSFEFFPPKTEKGEQVLWRSLEQLAPLGPDFVSVTYGAGGSTRTRTIEIVARIKRELGIEPMAHLTCVGATRDELARVLDQLADADVHNILALRGDPPQGQSKFEVIPGGLRHADELVAFVRERGPFCVGAACYPEVHPEAPDGEADLKNLKRKVDAGVDFLISQLFFDNASFHAFERRAHEAGITAPILPGIMPITNFEQIQRFTKMCGATIPAPLRTRMESIADDPAGGVLGRRLVRRAPVPRPAPAAGRRPLHPPAARRPRHPLLHAQQVAGDARDLRDPPALAGVLRMS
jgi:methylenetetrahydrofolate reductase (NADPH)